MGLGLLKETYREWVADDALILGAALAYYAALSLAPLVVTLTAIAGLVMSGDNLRGRVVEQVEQRATPETAGAVEKVLEHADNPRLGQITAILSTVMLLVGASTVFAQLKLSLNRIWNVPPASSEGVWAWIKSRLLAIGLVLLVGLLLIATLVASTALSTIIKYGEQYLPMGPVWASVLNAVFSIVVTTVLFGILFRVLPDVTVQWRDVWLGAVVTAVAFWLGQFLISLYIGRTGTGSAYGAAGSLIILLVWVYYSAQIFFFGAEFTQVWARRHGRSPTGDRKRAKER